MKDDEEEDEDEDEDDEDERLQGEGENEAERIGPDKREVGSWNVWGLLLEWKNYWAEKEEAEQQTHLRKNLFHLLVLTAVDRSNFIQLFKSRTLFVLGRFCWLQFGHLDVCTDAV